MKLNIGPDAAPERGLFNDNERRRMLMLCGLLVVVGTVFVISLKKQSAGPPNDEIVEHAPVVVVDTPKVDVAKLDALAGDATPEARVLIAPAALDATFQVARLLTPQHYAPMGGRELDRAAAAELLSDPAPRRGQLFRVRGWIEAFQPFDSVGGSTAHYRGRLRAEDGTQAYFAVLAVKDLRGAVGEFAVIDGLFLENHRQQGPDGWIDAPLLVGPSLTLSFPELDPVTELDRDAFLGVTDDSATSITGQPFHEYWKLVSYAQHLGEFDWSKAPVLDETSYADLREHGDQWRARAVRIPASELMDIWNQAQKENPLRLATMTEGWLGNWSWIRHGTGLVRFVAPFTNQDLHRKDIAEARGFFLKQSAYEMRDGNIGVVPLFVLASIEGYTPREDNTWTIVLAVVGGSLAVFGVLVGLALLRDRRKARALRNELVRRRRARRAQLQQS